MSKQKASDAPLTKLAPEHRIYAEQRQHGNGYRDVDGLTDELNQQGAEISRASAGRINRYLAQQAAKITEKTQTMRGVLDALGPNANDMGLVNIALLTDAIMDMEPELRVTAAELQALDAKERLAVFFKLVEAQRQLAQAQKPLKVERRVDMREAQEKLAKLEQDAHAGKRTIDLETLRIINEEVYGIYDQ